MEAHEAYVEHHRTALIPAGFVVPNDSPECPREHHGMALGKEAKGYRKQFLDQTMPLEDVRVLEDIGFAWERSEYQWSHVVVPALMAYKKVHGDVNVAKSFVVPAEDPWPNKSWGVRLGAIVSQIRSSGYFIGDHPGRRQWLEHEGFVFVFYICVFGLCLNVMPFSCMN